MSNFRPQITFITDESIRDYRNNQRKTQFIVNQYPTYKKLKRSLVSVLKVSVDEYVSVLRSRRGEWGEFYEHWILDSNGKPKLIKQGWN